MKSNYPGEIIKVRDLKFNDNHFKVNFLFPTPLYNGKLSLPQDKINFLIEKLYSISKHDGRHLSNYGAWQSTDLIQNKDFGFILDTIGECISNIFKDKNFSIIDLWGNITPRSGYNRIHNHINGTSSNHFAGVLYLKLPPHYHGTIGFCNPSDPNSTLIVPVEEKELLLFPSSIYHFVDPNLIDQDRISLAFNVLFDTN